MNKQQILEKATKKAIDGRWNKQTRRRFYEKVRPEGECLVWVGSIDKNGYGNCAVKSYGSGKPHRAIYLAVNGQADLVIDHLCSNRACVKLSHLEAVTQRENVLRSSTTRKTKSHCPNGHEWNDQTRRLEKSGLKCNECYRVRQSTPEYRAKRNERLRQKRVLSLVGGI